MIHSTIGLIHLVSAMVALVLGTMVLISKKGTQLHRFAGYGYVLSMLVLNGTAFGLYHLFGGIGPFHIAALVSLFTLMIGLIPMFLRSGKDTIRRHMLGMYYSVAGLYAAFASEIVVRIPGAHFFTMVLAATFLVMALSVLLYRRQHQKWLHSTDRLKTSSLASQKTRPRLWRYHRAGHV
jgi:uncharacterized membrane protein